MAFYDGVGSNFVISFMPDPKNDFSVFGRGYHNAASRLAEDLLSRGGFPDYDAYPVVFLYRHSLELYLKNVIYKSALLMAFERMDDIRTTLHNTHNLVILSKKATELIQRLFPHDEDLQLLAQEILKVSSEFSDIDPGSFGYRYPIDKKGHFSTKPHQVVSLEAIYRTMNELLESMYTLDFGLQIVTDQAQEMWEMLEEW